jgi:hypothetical protein
VTSPTVDDHAPVVPLEVAEALAAADRAVKEGRALAAIDLLTEANRALSSPDLEIRLVEVRHKARLELDRTPVLPAWPPVYPDHFADVVGRPPEITPDRLTSELMGSAITHHGCLVVRGLAGPERVRSLIAAIDRSIAAQDTRIAGQQSDPPVGLPESERPWTKAFKPDKPWKVGLFRRGYVRDSGGVLTCDSPRGMFELVEFFEEFGWRSLLEGYLGERPFVTVDKWTLRRVPTDTGTGWHQDGAFLGKGLRAVNLWIALTDCGGDDSDAPALDIVPRRFDRVVETGTPGAPFDTFVSPDVVDRERGDLPILRPRFAAGDALIFDDLFLHQTGVSAGMTRERHALESWFFAPSTLPDDQIPLVY